MPSNRCATVTRHVPINPAEGIEVLVSDKPQVGSRDVLIRLKLRSLNPADVMRAAGHISGPLPTVPGLEGMGVVEECGPACSGRFCPGQRVVGMPFSAGTWQQYVLADEDKLWPVPDAMTDEQAAQFYLNPFTAWGLLDTLNAPQGSWVLQTAAGSVLGRMLIQMAKHLGLRTVNVVRQAEQVQELKELGADEVVVIGGDSTEGKLAGRVKEITGGQGVYGAMDAIGGGFTAQVATCLRSNGTVLVYGNLSGSTTVSVNAMDMFKEVGVRGFVWSHWVERLGDRWGAVVDRVAKLIIDGTVTPYTGKRFPLDAVCEAVVESQKAGRGGKVLLEG